MFFIVIVALSVICRYFICNHLLPIFMSTWAPLIPPNSFQMSYFSIHTSAT